MLIHFNQENVVIDELAMLHILNQYLEIKNLCKINYEEKD